MIKYIVLVTLFLNVLLHPAIVQAQEDISLINSEVEIYFPGAMVFKVEAEGKNQITKIRNRLTQSG